MQNNPGKSQKNCHKNQNSKKNCDRQNDNESKNQKEPCEPRREAFPGRPVNRASFETAPSPTDPLGSWTGVPAEDAQPVQDADDL